MITPLLLMLPLLISGVLSVVLLFLEADLKWKILCPAVVLACLAMRFVVPIEIPFIVPFLLESLVAISLSIWLKLDYF